MSVDSHKSPIERHLDHLLAATAFCCLTWVAFFLSAWLSSAPPPSYARGNSGGAPVQQNNYHHQHPHLLYQRDLFEHCCCDADAAVIEALWSDSTDERTSFLSLNDVREEPIARPQVRHFVSSRLLEDGRLHVVRPDYLNVSFVTAALAPPPQPPPKRIYLFVEKPLSWCIHSCLEQFNSINDER